jgi:hypothetical protein
MCVEVYGVDTPPCHECVTKAHCFVLCSEVRMHVLMSMFAERIDTRPLCLQSMSVLAMVECITSATLNFIFVCRFHAFKLLMLAHVLLTRRQECAFSR